MTMITLADLVEKNRGAIENGSLLAKARQDGAISYTGCVYRYDKATKKGLPISCAIGALLDEKTIAAVKSKNFNYGTNLDTLARSEVISFNNDATRAIARKTQQLHDTWAAGQAFYCVTASSEVLDARLRSWLGQRQGKIVTEAVYQEWLTMVESVHLAA